jgi:hypothetical protein
VSALLQQRHETLWFDDHSMTIKTSFLQKLPSQEKLLGEMIFELEKTSRNEEGMKSLR